MHHDNHLEWKCLWNFVRPQKRFVFEIALCVSLFVGLASLLTIIGNHNTQSSTKTLSVRPDSDQVGLAKVIELHVNTNERIATAD